MPDKKYEELADKGWAAMTVTLDKEMPIEKDRKRLLLWLLLLSMFLGLSGLIYWNTKTSSTADYVQTEHKNNPKAQEQMIVTSEKESEIDINAKEEHDNIQVSSSFNRSSTIKSVIDIGEAQILQPASPENNHLKIDEVRKEKRELVGPIASTNRIDKQDLVTIEQETASIEQLVNASDNESGPTKTINAPGKISNKKEVVFEHAQLDRLASLSQGSINFLKKGNRDFASLKLTSAIARKSHYLRLFAGIALPVSSESAGFYGGLAIQRELDERWKLDAGLGVLSRFRSPITLLEDNDALDVSEPTTEFSDPAIDPEGFNQDSEVFATSADEVREEYFGLVSEKLLRSTYLDIPIELKYRFALKHEVGIGLRYGYLLSAKNDRIYLAELENSLAANAGFLNSNALTNANVINRHNASITSSYRYSVSKNLGLVANLNLGLNDIIRTNGQSDSGNKLNYIGLGIDYRLKM